MTKTDEHILQNPYAKIGYKLHLLLHTGQLLMESGADTNRIVRDMMRAAAFMGIPEDKIHLHIMYTTLMLNVSDDDHSYTSFRKCRHHGINMTIISAISKLSWRAMEEKYSLEAYEAELHRIENIEHHRHYSSFLSAISAGLACGGFCKLFDSDWIAFFLHHHLRRTGFRTPPPLQQSGNQSLCQHFDCCLYGNAAGVFHPIFFRLSHPLASPYCLCALHRSWHPADQLRR